MGGVDAERHVVDDHDVDAHAGLDGAKLLEPLPRLERREKLEQLRALEAGMRIDVAIVGSVPLGVDTPEDLEVARAALTSPPDPA